MAKIKKLSPLEAKKIAAGEVVEKPANIVKELVENSIDAGATSIFISIKNGGKTLIRVIDNGCGMSQEDALLSFEHHATSKITKVEDLESLYTYGFRGEALSSISAIAKITLVTKEANADTACKVVLHEAAIVTQEEVSAANGTDISIEDLFYTIPARLKFLKKDETEYRHIVALFQSYCFAYKEIHFKLFNDDHLVFNCPPVDDVKHRISQVWDNALAAHALPIAYEHAQPFFKIDGYVTNHQFTQFNKNKIFFFVNKRFVKNIELSRALLKGYANVLPQGKFPAGVIFIEVSPKEVDVNIHPRKEEVKLLHSFKIESALQDIVREKLRKDLSTNLQTTRTFQQDIKIGGAQSLPIEKSLSLFSLEKSSIDAKRSDVAHGFKPAITSDQFKELNNFASITPVMPEMGIPFTQQEVEHLFGGDSFAHSSFAVVEEIEEQETLQKKDAIHYNYIGQFKKTYLMLEQEDGLMLVDQHAAHECILYDLFLNRFHQVATVKLIFPQVITLSAYDVQQLQPHLSMLKKYGIEAELFGLTEIVITSSPVHLQNESIQELIMQIIAWVDEARSVEQEDFDTLIAKKLCAQMACKAAVKAGDELTREAVMQLLQDLDSLESRFTCPHGRPTFWVMPLYEIEKKFKRKA